MIEFLKKCGDDFRWRAARCCPSDLHSHCIGSGAGTRAHVVFQEKEAWCSRHGLLHVHETTDYELQKAITSRRLATDDEETSVGRTKPMAVICFDNDMMANYRRQVLPLSG